MPFLKRQINLKLFFKSAFHSKTHTHTLYTRLLWCIFMRKSRISGKILITTHYFTFCVCAFCALWHERRARRKSKPNTTKFCGGNIFRIKFNGRMRNNLKSLCNDLLIFFCRKTAVFEAQPQHAHLLNKLNSGNLKENQFH